MGATRCAINIWEIGILPALLNNSCCWDLLDPKVQEELEFFQNFFVRGLMAVPKSCPRPSLAYEANLLTMKVRTFSRALNLMKHLHSLDDKSLAKQVLNEQIS